MRTYIECSSLLTFKFSLLSLRKLIHLSTVSYLFILAFPFTTSAQFSRKRVQTSENFTVEKIAPGVWAAINNKNYGKAISNAGIIDMGNKTIVFDAFMTPEAAWELKNIAKQLTGKPVTLVINSHFHTDHVRGNQAFVPTAVIMSSRITREMIRDNEGEEKKWERAHAPRLLQALKTRMSNSGTTDVELPYWIGYYEGMVESSQDEFVALPDETFEDSLWITGTKKEIKLEERKNGHTVSDVVLLIPKQGIAFMGGLLNNKYHPWISDGDPVAWQESLRRYYEDTLYTIYVPAYGKVSQKEDLRTLYEYLDDMQKLSNNAKTDSAQETLMNQAVPAAYNDWMCSRFYQQSLEYLVQQKKKSKIKN